MAGKGGGSWKVAYADFVTAMMAFFMVMWITAQNKEAKESISNYFQDPFAKAGEANGPVNSLPGGGPAMNRKGEQGKRPGVKTGPSEPSGLGTTIQFAQVSAELDAAAKQHLLSLAPELSGIPQRIEIRGHASRAPLPADSSFKDPWALSYARCLATMQFLAENGIEPERMRLSQAGAHQPSTNAENADRQLENERVEVFVLREFVSPTTGVGGESHEAAEKDDEIHARGDDAHDQESHATPDHAASNPQHRRDGPHNILAAGHEAAH